MNDEILLIQLRDCFTGGYTLPQFCIDNGIKKPLFVAEKKFWSFIWEVYVQFRYDKRITAQFIFFDLPSVELNFSVHNILGALKIKNISELTPVDFDVIIFLTTKRIIQFNNVIYLDMLTGYFIRRTYCEIPLLNFLQRHPKVHIIVTNVPRITLRNNSAEWERRRHQTTIHQIRQNILAGKNFDTPYDFLGYTNQELLDLLNMTDAADNFDGSTSLKDCDNPLISVSNGKRVTFNQPEKFLNKIYFMGTCTFFGIGTPFDKTLESYLQALLNDNNLPYRVENESQFFPGRYQDIFYNLNNLNPAPGDIVFLCLQDLQATFVPSFDISNIFDDRTDRDKIFADSSHITELGYKILAEKFFALLTKNNFFRDVEFTYHNPPPFITDMVYLRNSNKAA